MADAPEKPLRSETEAEEEEETEAEEPETPEPRRARPAPAPLPRPTFKASTFLYVFLGLLGLWMLFDATARNGIACALGTYTVKTSAAQCSFGGGPLYSLIGFDSNYLLVTMALAGAIEMLITAAAYNFTTDWVKAARVQKWSQAFRKVQMEAIRSGKKDRIAALKPHQERLTRLSSEVSIAQFKGMAITYFLLILIYSWVGLIIQAANSAQQTISLGGADVNLYHNISGLPIPWWFVIFSLYTVPTSMIFRRILKHAWLRRYTEERQSSPPATSAA